MGSVKRFYRLLGEPAAEWEGVDLPLGPPQARRVFALLLVEATRLVSCDRIIDELWGDAPPASAKVQVQGLISGLRRALRSPRGDQPILTRGASYLLNAQPEEIDTGRFAGLVAEGRVLLAQGRHHEAAQRFREALALWRGPVLAGVPVAAEVIAHWEEQRLSAMEDRAEAELGLGEHDRLVPELRDMLAAAPFRERTCGQLMTALARAGRMAEALDVYGKWRRRLIDELGVEPSPAIRALQGEILRDGPEMTAREYPAYREPSIPSQLPPGIPDFVGRDALVAELLGELASADDRDTPPVLLLTGAGGIGKSSLAVRLAHQVADAYPDGRLFAALRGTTSEPRSPEAVLAGFLRAFGVPSDAVPADVDESACLFRSLVHGRRVLFVLDDAAGEAQLRPLLPAGGGCAVIVTSRFALAGLELGRSVPLDVLPAGDAAALLARLTGNGESGKDSLAAQRVLEYCGGLPLALRIVGSRIADRSGWELADVANELSVERPDESRATAKRALGIFTEIGDILGMAHLHASHAVASVELGLFDEAEAGAVASAARRSAGCDVVPAPRAGTTGVAVRRTLRRTGPPRHRPDLHDTGGAPGRDEGADRRVFAVRGRGQPQQCGGLCAASREAHFLDE
jgi:pentatricopeptide repeat protein